ncbi:MAG: helix-turn-helix protein [Solirubrobacteraceae bacterium]|jgi:transcriptional regulator with XRE-family HTH domain|nr:helix-turn-helix protein [Solirubrobacteraceae bacterium]
MPRTRRSKPRSPDHAALAQAIEMLIAEDAHMTQETVADDGGLSLKQVNELVRGQANPTYATLMKLARGLHVTPGRLITLSDELRDKRSRR